MPSLEATIRSWEKEEHRFLALAAEFDRIADRLPEEAQLHLAALQETGRRQIRESKATIAMATARLDGDA